MTDLREQVDFLKAHARHTAGVNSSEITIDVSPDNYRIFYQGGGWRIFKHPDNAIVGECIGFTNTKPQALIFLAEQTMQSSVKSSEATKVEQ